MKVKKMPKLRSAAPRGSKKMVKPMKPLIEKINLPLNPNKMPQVPA